MTAILSESSRRLWLFKNSAQSFSDRSFWKSLKVVDVRAFASWMSAPKCFFSRILTTLTEVFGRDIRANDPRMSAGCPSQKLPKGPFRTKNTTTIEKIVNYYAAMFLLRPPNLLRRGPFFERRKMSVIPRKMVSAQGAPR